MKIAIVGAGALGSLFGGLLARSGQEVWLYNCSFVEHVDVIRKRGLTLQIEDGEQIIPVSAVSTVTEIVGTMDLVGIFVKAYDTEQATKDALPLVGKHSWVLSLQNGIGQEEVLTRYVPKSQVLRGVTAQGATVVEPGVVRWAGCGPTHFGSLAPVASAAIREIHEIIEIFRFAGIEAHYESDIRPWVWGKLLVNAAINPLTALLSVSNGALLEDPAWQALLRDVVRETLPVVAAHGVSLSLEEAIGRVEGVCRATAKNLSSMLQDRRRGKKTEIESINGAIVREGNRLGFPTPLNRLVTEIILARPEASMLADGLGRSYNTR